MSQLISVIVPFYNTAEYLPQCINSILAQTYPHWELFLIDDTSKDNSLQIAQEYAQKDSRIRVLQMPENRGQAAARNYALREAKGELINFVDSDDYILNTMFAEMLQLLQSSQAEICICDTIKELENQAPGLAQPATKIETGIRHSSIQDFSEKVRKEDIFIADSPFCPVNKLFRRELFFKHKINFPEGLIWEDTSACALLLGHAQKIAYLARPLYYIRARIGSTTRQTEKTPTQLKREVYDYLKNLQIIREQQEYIYIYSRTEWQALTKCFLIHLRSLEHELRFRTRGKLRYQLYLQIFREIIRLFPYAPRNVLRTFCAMSIRMIFPKLI